MLKLGESECLTDSRTLSTALLRSFASRGQALVSEFLRSPGQYCNCTTSLLRAHSNYSGDADCTLLSRFVARLRNIFSKVLTCAFAGHAFKHGNALLGNALLATLPLLRPLHAPVLPRLPATIVLKHQRFYLSVQISSCGRSLCAVVLYTCILQRHRVSSDHQDSKSLYTCQQPASIPYVCLNFT